MLSWLASGKTHAFLELRNRFLTPSHLLVNETKPEMPARKIRVHLKCLVKLLYCLLVPPRLVERCSGCRAYCWGEGISLLCSSYFCDGLVWPSGRDEVEAVPVMSRRIVRVEFDSPFEFALGA